MLYQLDGTCRRTPSEVDPTFGSFTALPPRTTTRRSVASPSPPCTVPPPKRASPPNSGRNALVRWTGAYPGARAGSSPVPRLLRANTSFDAELTVATGPVVIPGKASWHRYTPEGAKLPPIFEPQSDSQRRQRADVVRLGRCPAYRFARARRSPVFKKCAAGSPKNAGPRLYGGYGLVAGQGSCCANDLLHRSGSQSVRHDAMQQRRGLRRR